jgi:hypothetical protein
MIERPAELHYETIRGLHRLFGETHALNRSAGRSGRLANDPVLEARDTRRLWGTPLPKPANMASGWRLLLIAHDAEVEILIAKGLLPPLPPPKSPSL